MLPFTFGLNVILMFFILEGAHAQSAHGVFKVVKGDVRLIDTGTGKESKVKIGLKVQAKDIVVTGIDSRTKIVMVDKNEINISPESRVEIKSYEYKPDKNEKSALINIVYGKVRAKVKQKYDGNNTFHVKTPTAVAGVRGTDFFTSFDSKSNLTKVVTFEGRVAFGAIGQGGAIVNPVIVNVGQTTSLNAGNNKPGNPVNMPKTELSQMNTESDASSSSSSSQSPANDNQRTPAKEKDDKNADSDRAPSSAGGSMLRSEDLASSDRPDVQPVLPEVMTPPIGSVTSPTVTLPPNTDFLREVIGSTKRKIILNVQTNP